MSIPILRAVPSTIFIAPSISAAFKSFIFVSAISFTLDEDTLPTFSRFGTPLPFSIPAAFFSRADAGGVFYSKLKDLSSYTVRTTGITLPA